MLYELVVCIDTLLSILYSRSSIIRSTLDEQVAFTTFRKPRMAALCLQLTLHDQVAFTTFRKPINDGRSFFAFNKT